MDDGQPREDGGGEGADRLKIIAFERYGPVELALFRAPPKRRWMDESAGRFAYRCLPLVIANQAGWLIRNPIHFSVFWNGGTTAPDLQVLAPPGQVGFSTAFGPESVVESHFGEGVLTFQLPYLFRTSPGYNLWVKGPANMIKDGIQPLEGMVETDWSPAPFTMNWKVTRPFHTITFLPGEPICQLIPYPRGLIERFDPEVRDLADEPELASAYGEWHSRRGRFLVDRGVPGTEAHRKDWQKEYFRGQAPAGGRVPDHQTALETKEFVRKSAERTDEA
ncbi:DUF6065 family protein [Tautonia sociabilis]|uniref:Uncharacterized protein n=1 Tax=Tautonia sociabilis TaxID=2080755 RepID=A0A432MMF0_9BACT|nr:DUF6065 family protein [Tautonia sociabilis]RUL88611.1 hypothetical protein TsocGM_06725 [Tautonia sociabilis]